MLKKRIASAVVTTICTGLLVTGVVAANPGGSTNPESTILVKAEDKQKTVDSKGTEESTEKDSSAIKEEKKDTEPAKDEDKKKTDVTKTKKEKQTDTKEKKTSESSANTNAGTSSASTSKPTNTTPSGSSGSGGQTQPSKPAHSHNFSIPITQTINHPAEYTEVYHPEVGHEVQRCKGCGIANPDSAHKEAHLLAGEPSGTYSDWVVDQAAWTEQVMVKAPWTEQVVTGYQCSCGAKR